MKGNNASYIGAMAIVTCFIGCRPQVGDATKDVHPESVAGPTNRRTCLLSNPTGDLLCVRHDFWDMTPGRKKVQIAEAIAEEVLSRKLVVQNGKYDDFARKVSSYGKDVFTSMDMLLEAGYKGRFFMTDSSREWINCVKHVCRECHNQGEEATKIGVSMKNVVMRSGNLWTIMNMLCEYGI